MKKLITFIFLLLIAEVLPAQDNAVEMADMMRSNGKIYVVVAILVVIFLGIVMFLFSIDRKLTRLENEMNSKDVSDKK